MIDQDIEIRRKVAHLVGGVILAGLVFYNIVNALILAIITLIMGVLFMLVKKRHIPILEWLLDNFERHRDRKHFPGKGSMYFLIGGLVVLILFPKDIAVAAILILAIGDSIPNIVGMYYKKVGHPFSNKRFLEGSLVGFMLSFLAVINFVIWYEALLATSVALFLEALDIEIGKWKFDDNIVIPVSAGFTIFILRLIF